MVVWWPVKIGDLLPITQNPIIILIMQCPYNAMSYVAMVEGSKVEVDGRRATATTAVIALAFKPDVAVEVQALNTDVYIYIVVTYCHYITPLPASALLSRMLSRA